MHFYLLVIVFLGSMLFAACGKSAADFQKEYDNIPINVNIPRDMINAEDDPAIGTDNSRMISLQYDGILYVGRAAYPLEALRSKVEQAQQKDPGRLIYFQGDFERDFHQMAAVFDVIRKAGGKEVGLIVHRIFDLYFRPDLSVYRKFRSSDHRPRLGVVI